MSHPGPIHSDIPRPRMAPGDGQLLRPQVSEHRQVASREPADACSLHTHLNFGENLVGVIERQAIHRGTFTSVKHPTTEIRSLVNGRNGRSHSFIWVVWTRTAYQILTKENRQGVSNLRH